MKRIVITLSMIVVSSSAYAAQTGTHSTPTMQIGLGAGYGMTSGYDFLTSKAGLTFGMQAFTDLGLTPGLLLGLEGGYNILGVYEKAATASSTLFADYRYTAIPVLAAGKYTFYDNIYGMLGLGVSFVRVSANWTGTPTDADKTAVNNALSTASATKFTSAIGVGYSFKLNTAWSIDPTAKFYMIFADAGSIKNFVPSVNLLYRF